MNQKSYRRLLNCAVLVLVYVSVASTAAMLGLSLYFLFARLAGG